MNNVGSESKALFKCISQRQSNPSVFHHQIFSRMQWRAAKDPPKDSNHSFFQSNPWISSADSRVIKNRNTRISTPEHLSICGMCWGYRPLLWSPLFKLKTQTKQRGKNMAHRREGRLGVRSCVAPLLTRHLSAAQLSLRKSNATKSRLRHRLALRSPVWMLRPKGRWGGIHQKPWAELLVACLNAHAWFRWPVVPAPWGPGGMAGLVCEGRKWPKACPGANGWEGGERGGGVMRGLRPKAGTGQFTHLEVKASE